MNTQTDRQTHTQTDRQAQSNMPFQLFQSWGHKNDGFTNSHIGVPTDTTLIQIIQVRHMFAC